MPPKIANNSEDAVSSIKDNEAIWTHNMAATPTVLLKGLAKHALSCRNLTLLQLHTEGDGAALMVAPQLRGHLRCRCYFVSAVTRKAVQNGDADYVPILLAEVPKLIRSGEQRIDTAIIQVSPPDKHGNCSLGVSVEATHAALEKAGKIIAHINPQMPRTHGDGLITYKSFHTVYEESVPISCHAPASQNDVYNSIGQNVAALVQDRDCIQTGIGAIPDAVLACLGDRKDLGVHTEMFSDGILPLVEKGVITGAYKKNHPGKIVTSFVIGSQKLYDFVDDNSTVQFLDTEYVNDMRSIQRNPQAMSINSAIQVDLTGQVCADSMGTKIYSGFGGQIDFVRGASLSEGGRGVIALPSTAAGGSISRITTTLSAGAGVVTTRAHVHYIATEYGVVSLRGRSLRERTKDLINIAHPDFREELNREAFEKLHLSLN
ncbi:acetyl-CoA hydrolase/transferase family protein [Neptunomonas japonica]|uniref:acetyl-CoA hydrolase/transferase family protein n=1 Tax=Neptunomonas japonica TaxID=417574 RepID=UPI000414566C|nr:acetyl-CoA hydrolase/transferase C-terminal domain-containing protein [Neptunomonas japonica]